MGWFVLLVGATAGCGSSPAATVPAPGVRPFDPDLAVRFATAGTLPRQAAVVPTRRGARVYLANGGDFSPVVATGYAVEPGQGGRHPRLLPAWYSDGGWHDQAVATGDLDGDGHPDLVYASFADATQDFATGGVRVHWGGADGPDPRPAWIAGGPGSGVGFGAADLALGDLDADGDLDVAVAVAWERDVRVESLPAPAAVLHALPFRWHPAPPVPALSPRFDPFRIDDQQYALPGLGAKARDTYDGWPRVLENLAAQGRPRTFETVDLGPPPAERVFAAAQAGSPWAAVTVDLADLTGDGWLDLVLGARRLTVLPGPFRPARGFAPPRSDAALPAPAGLIHAVRAITHGPVRMVAAAESCTSLGTCADTPVALALYPVEPDGGALRAQRRAAALPGSPGEVPAGLAVGDITGDGHPDLLLSAWTRAGGAEAGGHPVVAWPGGADGFSEAAVALHPPEMLAPGRMGSMPAEVRVAPICPGADPATYQHRVTLTAGTRSAVDLPGGPAGWITAVQLDGVPLDRCGAGGSPCWIADEDGAWLTLAPPVVVPEARERTLGVTTAAPGPPGLLVVDAEPGHNLTLYCH